MKAGAFLGLLLVLSPVLLVVFMLIAMFML